MSRCNVPIINYRNDSSKVNEIIESRFSELNEKSISLQSEFNQIVKSNSLDSCLIYKRKLNQIVFTMYTDQMISTFNLDYRKVHVLSQLRMGLNKIELKLSKLINSCQLENPVIILGSSSCGMSSFFRYIYYIQGSFPLMLTLKDNVNQNMMSNLSNRIYHFSIHNEHLNPSIFEAWARKKYKIYLALRDPISIHIVNYYHLQHHPLPWLKFDSDDSSLKYYKDKCSFYKRLPLRNYVLQENCEATIKIDPHYVNYLDPAWKHRNFKPFWQNALFLASNYPRDLLFNPSYSSLCDSTIDVTIDFIKFANFKSSLYSSLALIDDLSLPEKENPINSLYWDNIPAYAWHLNHNDYLSESDQIHLKDRYSFLYNEIDSLYEGDP